MLMDYARTVGQGSIILQSTPRNMVIFAEYRAEPGAVSNECTPNTQETRAAAVSGRKICKI